MPEKTLGKMIRDLRKQNHMTQAALAGQLGITDKAVSKWERELSYPDLSLFPRLADLLGVSADELLASCTDEENPSRLARIFAMSHDVRTPLNIILGYANLSLRCLDDPERLRRYLGNILFSGEYLLTVIERLMQVAGRDPVRGTDALPADRIGESFRSAADARPDERPHDFTGKRVLLAEDLELNREIVAEILKTAGIETEFAADGQLCIDLLLKSAPGRYDLILMDLQMPNKSGIEAAREIRALRDDPRADIPIIAMSASVYEADRRAAFAAGMNDFIEKPIRIEALFEALKQFL